VSTVALVLLALTSALGLLFTARGERTRPAWGAVALASLLGAAALVAWLAGPAPDGVAEGGVLAATLAAVIGGGPVATAVLRAADPREVGAHGGPADPDILRGGAWIGVLERAGVAVTLLADWPEGLAIVLAVKGLGRYNELRTTTAAAERFILGTLVSALWAAACVGAAVLLRQ
jgi:hypothetical protein